MIHDFLTQQWGISDKVIPFFLQKKTPQSLFFISVLFGSSGNKKCIIYLFIFMFFCWVLDLNLWICKCLKGINFLCYQLPILPHPRFTAHSFHLCIYIFYILYFSILKTNPFGGSVLLIYDSFICFNKSLFNYIKLNCKHNRKHY